MQFEKSHKQYCLALKMYQYNNRKNYYKKHGEKLLDDQEHP